MAISEPRSVWEPRAGDDDAGRHGDQQGRDLGGETVTDGQQRVVRDGVGDRQVVLQDADHNPADQVDRGDDDRGHRVAAHELGGAVHRAVEVGLASDLRAACAGDLVGDQAGVEVGVDRHLLAGHRVEGEAGAHLGHSAGAVGHDDELDHDQDHEDDQADHDVAPDHEVTEGADDAARVAGGQDLARHRDVDRQAEHRREQQQRRERREVQRLVDVHRGHDDRQAAGDVHRDQQVQELGRERDHQHRDDQHDADRGHQVGVGQDPAQHAFHQTATLRRAAIRYTKASTWATAA